MEKTLEVFPKINAPFKRYLDGPQKGKLIVGEWSMPELEYLQNNEFEFTEKVDGTNIRIGWDYKQYDVYFAGRSDNASIPTPLLDYLEDYFTPYMFEKAGLNTSSLTLFGEGYGPKIQGGGKYRDDHSFVLFDVKIGDWWLLRKDVDDIASKLGIDSVPVLGHGTLWQAINYVKYGTPYHDKEVRDIRQASDNDWLSKAGGMKSQWGDFEAEGIVATPAVPLFTRRGDRIITKIKGKDFR